MRLEKRFRRKLTTTQKKPHLSIPYYWMDAKSYIKEFHYLNSLVQCDHNFSERKTK